jgi:AraC-like DNA-binding protein
MESLPLAWLATVLATIAAFTLMRSGRVPRPARLLLSGFLACLAIIAALLGARLSFDAGWAARVQPAVAVMVAPLAYLGFRALTQDDRTEWRLMLLRHAVPIVVCQLVILGWTGLDDVIVLGVTGLYLTRMATLLALPADSFINVPPHALAMVRAALSATLALLALILTTDSLILAAAILGGDAAVLRFLSGASGLLTAVVLAAALIGAPMVLRAVTHAGAGPKDTGAPSDADRALLAAMDALMTEKNAWRDSNLTLARTARRLGVPARDVSNAVNRCAGENFSRYINGHRIRHAQQLLRETDLPITEVMFESGFVSKSSFNTEFRRIVGQTPSGFRAGAAVT